MPDPKKYDSKDDFMKACIPMVQKEGTAKDSDQAVAICNSIWERKNMKTDMKLDTVNIGNVEIFETGTWKGVNYTEKDIDDMIENFNNGIAEPFVTIDHSDKATAQFKDALQALSLGFVSGLKRVGKKMIADFKQVPKTVADLIEAGALKKKSIEFFRRFIANGKDYKNVLQGVTFHGANGLPEVNTLSDFLNLYKSSLQTMDVKKDGIVSLENSDKEVITMSDIQLKKDEYNDLLKAQSQVDVISSENERIKKDFETLKSENAKTKAEIERMKSEYDEYLKDKAESLKNEAESYIDEKIKNGKIKPAHRDRYVSEYVTYKKDEKLFKDWHDDIENRGKVIDFNPVETPKGEQTNFKYEPEKLDFKEGSTINYDELNERIESVMKAKGISFEQACIECGVAHPEEFDNEKGGE